MKQRLDTMTLERARKALCGHADPQKARVYRGYFKETTDIFLGVPTPKMRRVAREFVELPLRDVRALMSSRIHDERSLAHAILVLKYRKGDDTAQKEIFEFYILNREFIRSWDGVDDSAPYIVGPYLLHRSKKLLYQLAHSPRLWDRRIAMVTTWWFIRHGEIRDALNIARILLKDEEDLIHKAVGWMLREVGKRDLPALERFLKAHHKSMPRTILRYAIERFPERKRQSYLAGRI
ncbi:MAG TPA: DNA alkylation repair protein [Candidatus Acidoferrales bacterium]|nr:DNA alkylation repair protein [Candidatus Acidoferrales bacterium]